jgi:hypothetical protein
MNSAAKTVLFWTVIVVSALLLWQTVKSGSTARPEKSTQTSPNCPIEGMSPSEVVDQIWLLATQGELLTPDGWQRAGRFFTKPIPYPSNEVIQIMSNYWGPASVTSSNNQRAEVFLGYLDLGKIDPALRYSDAPEPHYMKMAMSYHLVLVPGYIGISVPDGKGLLDKKPTGKCVWQIEGSQGTPWTTVNTAIRYMMEARDKARDGAIRRNADQTLSRLKLLH